MFHLRTWTVIVLGVLGARTGRFAERCTGSCRDGGIRGDGGSFWGDCNAVPELATILIVRVAGLKWLATVCPL